MNKLSNKEIILVLVVINFVLYYLLVMIGVNPIKASIDENNVKIDELQTEYDEKKAIVDSEQTYIDTIARLQAEKAELFTTGFPNTNAENLHAFMNKEATANSVNLSSISIEQTPRMAAGPDGVEKETGIMDNVISISTDGNYANVTKLIKSIEEVQKTSILTSLDLGGTAGEMQASLGYSFLSADKTENPDAVFDHNFNQAAGNTALFK